MANEIRDQLKREEALERFHKTAAEYSGLVTQIGRLQEESSVKKATCLVLRDLFSFTKEEMTPPKPEVPAD